PPRSRRSPHRPRHVHLRLGHAGRGVSVVSWRGHAAQYPILGKHHGRGARLRAARVLDHPVPRRLPGRDRPRRQSRRRRVAGPPQGEIPPATNLETSAVSFPPAEVTRLRSIFPTGVCDWSKPGVGQTDPISTWITYTGVGTYNRDNKLGARRGRLPSAERSVDAVDVVVDERTGCQVVLQPATSFANATPNCSAALPPIILAISS